MGVGVGVGVGVGAGATATVMATRLPKDTSVPGEGAWNSTVSTGSLLSSEFTSTWKPA